MQQNFLVMHASLPVSLLQNFLTFPDPGLKPDESAFSVKCVIKWDTNGNFSL